MFKNYYKILEINFDDDYESIKGAYYRLSIKFRPNDDANSFAVSKLKDINEAFYILKDEHRKKRYDSEYFEFKRFSQGFVPESESDKPELHYVVQDKELQSDIDVARRTADELVNDYLRKRHPKSKLFWKLTPIIIIFVLIFLISLPFIISSNYESSDDDFTGEQIENLTPYIQDQSWYTYESDDGSFSIGIPNTMERRTHYQGFDKHIEDLGFEVNPNVVIFQQKGLDESSNNYDEHYARIFIQHFIGNDGDFPSKNETFPLEYDMKDELDSMVDNEVGVHYKLIEDPTYSWISIGGTNAIQVLYRRTGNKGNTTNCKIFIFFNSDEMVKVGVVYREQEKDLWIPDLDNVIRTFRWLK